MALTVRQIKIKPRLPDKSKFEKTLPPGIILLEIPLRMVYNDKNAQILALRERILVLGVDFFVTE